MQYAWFIFAVVALFGLMGVLSEIATALSALAGAWIHYIGSVTEPPKDTDDVVR